MAPQIEAASPANETGNQGAPRGQFDIWDWDLDVFLQYHSAYSLILLDVKSYDRDQVNSVLVPVRATPQDLDQDFRFP